jgi:aspartyl-tRNA(Asn)/glutamyl-tRNA(Gln) amidotransferase subunit B
MNNELARLLDTSKTDFEDSNVTPEALAELIGLINDGTILGKAAKDVLEKAVETGGAPREIVKEAGLTPISDAGEIEAAIERVIDANEKAVADYLGGKAEALKYLVGQVMRETKGRARPDAVAEILMKILETRP